MNTSSMTSSSSIVARRLVEGVDLQILLELVLVAGGVGTPIDLTSLEGLRGGWGVLLSCFLL